MEKSAQGRESPWPRMSRLSTVHPSRQRAGAPTWCGPARSRGGAPPPAPPPAGSRRRSGSRQSGRLLSPSQPWGFFSAFLLVPEKVGHGRLVAVQAQAADLAHAGGCGDAPVPELLPLVDVGYVHLNAGHVHRLEGVQDGVGVVGIRPGVQHDGVVHAVGGVDGVENGPLVVGLEALRPWRRGRRRTPSAAGTGSHSCSPVDARLPLPQQIQVGAVDDQELHA